ncbi:MAG: alpha/beta hydrolase [Bacilli bacterium]|nr:alpha/beta hydrolase [Bacilli bacterium]
MQEAINLVHRGMTLRGMQHFPDGQAAGPLPAAILFHGFTSTKMEAHQIFVKISRALANLGIASFRFDFLGSGESDGKFEDMTLSKEIDEAHAILNFVQNDSRIDSNHITLIGFSMGGLVASAVAGERKEEISKLILLAPAGNMSDLVKEEMAGIAKSADLASVRAVDRGGNLVGLEFGMELMQLDIFQMAKGYQGPVLLIHGTADGYVPVQIADKFRELCYGDQATIKLILGADHTFNKFEWEQEVIQEISNYIQ